MAQVPDRELFWAPDEENNSIAIIVKHLWGNMRSRWAELTVAIAIGLLNRGWKDLFVANGHIYPQADRAGNSGHAASALHLKCMRSTHHKRLIATLAFVLLLISFVGPAPDSPATVRSVQVVSLIAFALLAGSLLRQHLLTVPKIWSNAPDVRRAHATHRHIHLTSAPLRC